MGTFSSMVAFLIISTALKLQITPIFNIRITKNFISILEIFNSSLNAPIVEE